MHLFALLRGCKFDVDRTIQDLNSKYVPFEHKTHGKGVIRVMANPVQLVEIIFPKDQLSCIVNSLGGNKLKGQTSTNFLGKYISIFRKMLHLQAIDNIDENTPKLPIHFENSEIICLGIKDDKPLIDGTEGI